MLLNASLFLFLTSCHFDKCGKLEKWSIKFKGEEEKGNII